MLFDAAGTFVFQNSHDEWLSVSARTKNVLSRLCSCMPAILGQPLSRTHGMEKGTDGKGDATAL